MSVPTNVTQPNAPTQEVVPSAQTLNHAARLAIQQDKPIMLDYFLDTYNNKAFMGEDDETKEKMLIKSNDEFTSIIQKIYKVQEDFIVLTENSIYIVSGKVQKRRIKAKSLREKFEQ
jgi:hypothetical protein|uniref:Uncharacterized protein n=1 Tax=viral metagenome TaxID=1070528 RepID=A0A6C0IE85_9ZZZZ